MNYGDRIQWDHNGEVWAGCITGTDPAGQANWLTITLDADGLSYDVPESAVVRERSTMQADSIKIECDEDGFHLVLQLDEEIPLVTDEGRLDINVHNCADALHEQVNLIIGGWLAEGERAQKEHRAVGRNELGEYGLDEARHPDWHNVHADLWDAREGK